MATEVENKNKIRIDTLLPVSIGIVLVSLPLYQYLAPLILWYAFTLTVWSVLIARRSVPAPAGWLRLVLAALVIWALYFSYGVVFGLIPGTSMVILLSYLKLFEIKSERDISVLIFVGYFLAASVFFHSQSLWVALYVFLLAIYFTSLLVLVADRKGSVSWRERLRYAVRMVAQSLPLMLIMFVLFPRIPGPLWALPKDAQSATTGLSEEMTPGNVSNLVASYDVAFRVKFEKRPPDNRDLYWRGLVLSSYDGKTWRRDDAPSWTQPDVLRVSSAQDQIHYRVLLEPHNQKWLYSLELVTAFDSFYLITRELQLFRRGRVNNVIGYSLSSSFQAVNRALYPPERINNIALPQGLNPRTVELGRRLRQQAGGNAREIISAALNNFSQQEFYYTLSPPLLGENAMDDFLFNSRRGFCEHYASAFVYLMRSAGVPARVILGYQGGELNPINDNLIVRQSDAHAWAEVWVDNDHWLRVDPTSAVAPQRIERGIQNAGLEAQLLPRMFMLDNAILNRARFMWDSMQSGWNQWIVGFDENKQLALFRLLGIKDLRKSDLALWLVAAMSAGGLLVAWWVVRSNPYAKKDKVRVGYEKFKNKLARKGIVIIEQDTQQELLDKIRKIQPNVVNQAADILRQYQELIYGLARNHETEKQFVRVVRQFRV